MNTKYKHMLKFLEEQKRWAYVKGFKKGTQTHSRKSFAKGFLFGLVICYCFTKILGLWY